MLFAQNITLSPNEVSTEQTGSCCCCCGASLALHAWWQGALPSFSKHIVTWEIAKHGHSGLMVCIVTQYMLSKLWQRSLFHVGLLLHFGLLVVYEVHCTLGFHGAHSNTLHVIKTQAMISFWENGIT
jgi:hypothetical protein